MTVQPHFFIAIPISALVKKKLSNWCQEQEPPFQRFVHEEDLHITLAFLGGIETSLLLQLKEKLHTVSKLHQSFSLTVEGLGVFGQEVAPRVFWASVKKEEKLFLLQKSIYDVCVSSGVKLEKRAYSPHITLARKYSGLDPYRKDGLNEAFQASFQNECFPVSSFVIYQTHLSTIPKYEIIAAFELS